MRCITYTALMFIAMLFLMMTPSRAFAAAEFNIRVRVEGNGVVRAYENADDYLLVTPEEPATFGPYSPYEKVALPPVRLEIDSVDAGYYFAGRSWGGTRGDILSASQVGFSSVTEVGGLGRTGRSTSTDGQYVTYRFEERKSTLVFEANAPDTEEVLGTPATMSLHAADKTDKELPPSPKCESGSYWFCGWNTEPDGSGEQFDSLDSLYATLRNDDYLAIREFKLAHDRSLDLRLYAQWERASYEVRYEAGAYDVEGMPANAQNANVGVAAALARDPERPGYRFDGWQTSRGDRVASTAELDGLVSASGRVVTLTAIWRKCYAVRLFTGAGGTEPLASINAVEGYTQALPTPTRRGFSFGGWSLRMDASVRVTTTAELDELATPGGTVDVDSEWIGLPYTITYNACGGTGSIADQDAVVGRDTSLSDGSALQLSAHEFVGWTIGTGDSVRVVESTGDFEDQIEEAGQIVELRARWAPWYVLSFIGEEDDEGITGLPDEQRVRLGADEPVAPGKIPQRAGYAFSGWSLQGTIVTSTAKIADLMGEIPVGGKIVLQATWIRKYDVTFTLGDGPVPDAVRLPSALNNITVGSNIMLGVPSNVADGWEFVGWYLEGGNERIINTSQLDTVALAASGTIELVAKWQKHYAVTYELADGNARSSMEVVSGSWKLGTPERVGYDFDGWTYSQGGKDLSIANAAELDALVPAGAVVLLTAHWKPYYQLVYDTNGGLIDGVTSVKVVFGTYPSLLTPVRDNYVFTGWYRDTEGISEQIGSLTSDLEKTFTAGETIVLHARWSKIYNIQFDTGAAADDVDAPTSMTAVVGEAKTIYGMSDSDAWSFDGWYRGEELITSTTQLDDTEAGGSVTLVAHWRKRYVVALDANGGILNGDEELAVAAGDSVALPNATRSGYRFDGWYLLTGQKVIGGSEAFESQVSAGGKVQLIAHWTKRYSIVLENNDGTGASSTWEVYAGERLLFPAANRNGYQFDGWVRKVDDDKRFYTASTQLDDFAEPGGIVYLQASWTKSYTVLLDYADGSGRVTNIDALVGQSRTLDTPTREGYRFDGWYTKSGAHVEKTAELDQRVAAGSNITLAAHWTAWYTVSFDAAGIGRDPIDMKSYYGEAQDILALPDTDAWRFDGWFTGEGANARRVTSTSQIDSTPAGGKVLLVARWTKRYTITLDAAGGSSVVSAIVVTAGERPSLPVPTREGYRFDGWYLNDLLIADASSLEDAVEAGGSVTLTAHWSATYVVRLDAAGGSVKADTLTVVAGEFQELPAPAYYGRRFDGWRLQSDDERVVTSTADLDALVSSGGEVTLTAAWSVCYRIELEGTGVATEVLQVVVGEPTKLPVPTRDGYRFDGWIRSGFMGVTYADSAGVDKYAIPGGLVHLQATWTKTYSVTLDPANGDETKTIVAHEGESQKFPDISRDGYKFAGWTYNNVTVTSTLDLDSTVMPGSMVTVVAVWHKKFTVEFDANGGTVLPAAVDIVSGKDEFGALPIPVHPGYSFEGWLSSDATIVESFDEIDAMAEPGDVITLRAVWAMCYTVVFDAALDDEVAVAPMAVTAGKAQPLPTPHQSGWHFIGWTYNSVLVTSTADLDTYARPGGTINIIGEWAKTYKVILNPGLGSVEPSMLEVSVGDDRELPIPTRANYAFDGWVSAGGVQVHTTSDLDAAAEAGDSVYIRALWRKQYSVRFDTNGGYVETNMLAVIAGKTQTLPDPVREGWIFGGWSTADATKIVTTAELDDIVDAGSSILVHAIWYKTYTIRLDAAQGTVDPSSIDVVVGQGDPIELPIPVRHGYRFDGWVTEQGKVITNTASLNDEAEPGDVVIVRARWSMTYSIELNIGGGSDTPPIKIAAVAGENQELSKLLRDGYEFEGWMTDPDRGIRAFNTADLDAVVTPGGVISLYPAWRGVRYYVDFDANGGEGTIASREVTVGEAEQLPSGEGLVRGRYAFAAWLSNPSGDGAVVSSTADLDSQVTHAGQRITVYAGWVEHIITYLVHYESNADGDEVSNMPVDQSIVVGEVAYLAPGVHPTRYGWSFDGWEVVTSTARGMVTTSADIISLLGDVPADDVVSVHATWHKTYDLTIDLVYQDAYLPTPHTDPQVRSWLPDPICSGYQFAGWIASDGTPIHSLSDADEMAEPGGTLSVSASWLKRYSVVLYPQMGDGQVTTIDVVEGKAVAFAAPANRADYAFVEWNLRPNGTGERVAGTGDLDTIAKPGETLAVYAIWRQNAPGDYVNDAHSGNSGKSDGTGGHGNDIGDTTDPDPSSRTISDNGYIVQTVNSGASALYGDVQRIEIPAEVTDITRLAAANTPYADDRSFPPASGKASRVAQLIKEAQADGDAGAGEDAHAVNLTTTVSEAIAAVANRNTWAGAGAMAVAGSAAIVGVSMFGAIMNGTAGAQILQASGVLSAKISAAGKGITGAFKKLLSRLFSW